MGLKRNIFGVLLLVFLFLYTPVSFAERENLVPSIDFDQVVINSQNWEDVYYGLVYAKLVGKPVDYLIVPDIAVSLVESLNPSLKKVLLIESDVSPQYKGLDRLIEKEGYSVVKVPGSGSFGVRLAQTISPKGVIVLDTNYPYNSVSIAPYAIARNEYVLFADAYVIDEVNEYVASSSLPVTIFGLVDSSVSSRLSVYEPTIIDKGGKFENNLFVVKEFLALNPSQQVIVSNGEFIEKGLIDDFNAIVFVGQSNVPDVVEDFFVQENITVSVLVGNYLTDQMSFFKSDLKSKYGRDLDVFVRFAQTPRQVTSQFGEPQSLEFFPLPIILPKLEISSMSYNRLSHQLEVTYTNPSLIQSFFVTSLSLTLDDGSVITVGQEDVESIVAGQSRTVLYPVDKTPVSANAFLLFGDYPLSQEFSLSQKFDSVPVIEIADDSVLEIEKIVYDKLDKAFYITVSNPSAGKVFAQLELVDIIIEGLPQTIGTKEVFEVPALSSKTVFIRAELQSLDIVENENVLVRANYGARKLVLFKKVEQELLLSVRIIKTIYVVVGMCVLAILAVIFTIFLAKKKSFVCDRCGDTISSRKKPGRHVCGGKYK